MRSFGSDNHSGVHPAIMRAIESANTDHTVAYGDDPWTARAKDKFREMFGSDIEVFFVFNGTAANVLGLSALLKPFQAVICADTAHIQTDECGAPERFTGSKLLIVPTPDGKLRPDDILGQLEEVGFEHHVQPGAVSISQATELGTLYSLTEIRSLARVAHDNGLFLHMDGARIANAAVALGLSPAELTRDAGVDVLSFGGTKNGMMFGEAIVFFHPEQARDFKYIRKQGMQLASKMRFISAQFEAYLRDDLWAVNARQANTMAQLLAEQATQFEPVVLSRPVEINQVFVTLPETLIERLQEQVFFYVWEGCEVRWMTSFNTTEADIERFIEIIEHTISNDRA
jgi:threonine aldolase